MRWPGYDLGIRYLGVCCGAGPHHIRAMADMSMHAFLATDPSLKKENWEYVEVL